MRTEVTRAVVSGPEASLALAELAIAGGQERLDLLQGQAFVSQADNAMQAVNDCLIKEPIIALRPPRFFNEPKFQIKVQRIA